MRWMGKKACMFLSNKKERKIQLFRNFPFNKNYPIGCVVLTLLIYSFLETSKDRFSFSPHQFIAMTES